MKIKKLTACILSLTICFLMISPVAFALNIVQPTMYSVKILPGSGRILTNNEESKKNFYNPDYPDRQYHFILASPSDFEELDDIQIEVGEYETIKNRINYSAEGLEANWHEWYNDAFITSTKIVKGILSNGLETRLYDFQGAAFSGLIYPRYNLTAYLFVPEDDNKSFSHFEDQNGNRFDLNEPVTRDLVLTPVYTTDEVTDTLFNQEIHQVRFEKGEGTIKRCSDGSLTNYNNMDDWDEIVFNVLDGDKAFDSIDKAFALQKHSDLESANDFLHKSADLVLSEIDANHPAQAIDTFINVYIQGIKEHFFSDPIFTKYSPIPEDEEGNPQYERINNNVSLAFVLTVWMELYGEGYTSEDMFRDTVEKAMNYDTQTESEQAETIEQMKNVLFAFSDAWDNYLLAEYRYLGNCPYFITRKMIDGYFQAVPIYLGNDDVADPAWLFEPPSNNYVFSHFEDQDGNIFVLGEDDVKRDLVLTPIYYSRFDPRLDNNITGKVFVDTEDKSNEDFNVSVIRNHKNTLNEVFDKGDYDGTEFEYLNDKSSYHFNESDWTIDADGTITDYTGELVQMLGIPDSINGITVTGVSTDAFSELYNRFAESYTGPHISEAPYDYCSEHPMSIWIPKTVAYFSQSDERISERYKADMLENIRVELQQQGKSEEDIENCIEYYETALEVTLEENGTNNCTPLAYLPLCYVVVEDGNPNYASLGGSLYNNDMTTLLYLSYAANLDSATGYSREDLYRGLEIPNSVTTISAFATYNAIRNEGSRSLLHAYGHTVFDVYYALMNIHVNTPESNYLEELCQTKFGKSYTEIEDMIAAFYNPPAEVEQSFDETTSIAFLAAQEAGLMDENGNPLVSDDELVPFVLSYYASWLDSYPEYRFNEFAMMISTFVEGIFDPATNEQLVSDDELFAWQTTYIETYSNGAVRFNEDSDLIPNFTDEEITEMEAIAESNEAGKLYSIEDVSELFSVSYSLLTFILITNQDNVNAAEEPYKKLYSLFVPNASPSELAEAWEAAYYYIQASTDFVGSINRYGTASENNPMETVFVPDDNYTYIAYLTDIPERYIKPDVLELNPSDENMRNGTINLRLKRGNVDIITYDENDSSFFLEATYAIKDADGNIVGTITTHKDGTAVQVSDLTYGSYSVIQTSIEDGYYPNTSVKQFEITEDGDLIHLSFSNIKIQTLYSVKIPKTVILSGRNGLGICTISVIGKLQNNQSVIVRPINNTFNLFEQNASVDIKAPIAATVTQTKSVWTSSDLSEDTWSSANVTISAPITAGAWKGVLGIEIVLSVN